MVSAPATTLASTFIPLRRDVRDGFAVAFAPEESRVGQMRRITTAKLRHWRLDDLVDVATLVVSELVTNAIRHGKAQHPVELRVSYSADKLHVQVTDGSSTPARLRPVSDDDESGRGLYLVDGLADDWGVSECGTRTWCSFQLPAGRS
ncbi:ATP-binding protein [Streptomyces sp. NBC_00237]|uniref:ATP-binding protein n=1 Tax=Streptomyces sp. NBC_00237 TaxID=2975687 RepID=UPI002257BBB1|nr:ATP-binding protein [Streptomyces sp. NBC_00237]MCX5206728.1 ATP-binding protein [Streptomyces sp. NBC_00237]